MVGRDEFIRHCCACRFFTYLRGAEFRMGDGYPIHRQTVTVCHASHRRLRGSVPLPAEGPDHALLIIPLTSGSPSQHLQPMQDSWQGMVAFIRGRRLIDAADPFASAFGGVEDLATFIAAGPLNSVLFGWTSMFDLCIQQVDVEPYSGSYLRVSPLLSGQIEFRYVDTGMAERQWRREVAPNAAVSRFIRFVDQLGWVRQ